MRRAVLCACLVSLLCGSIWAQRNKKKNKDDLEPPTQVLELPKDPPNAVTADSSKLSFHVSPLSAKGLLTQQVKDALNALNRQNRGAQMVRIRAFVAGSGDLRRIPAIVSEVFTDKRVPLPAVTAVQVGALPLEGAQVLLESIAQDRRQVTPHGVAFISGQVGAARTAADPLIKVLGEMQLQPAAVRRITCFLNSLEHLTDTRTSIATTFPGAAATFVQLRRDSAGDFIECEAVAALDKSPAQSPEFTGVLTGRYSQGVRIGPGPLVFTGIQLGFGTEAPDVRLAFERLRKTLEGVRSSTEKVVFSNTYPLTNAATEQVRKIRAEFWTGPHPPGSTLLLFEGLSSPDALFGFEAIAVPEAR